MKTVLVIDDELAYLAVVQKALEPHFNVLTAVDGEEGLALALEKKPDLILADILMPKKDGYYLVEQLRKHLDMRNTPVVLLTAVDETSSLLRVGELGVTDYLIKPFRLDELIRLVHHYIRTGPPPF